MLRGRVHVTVPLKDKATTLQHTTKTTLAAAPLVVGPCSHDEVSLESTSRGQIQYEKLDKRRGCLENAMKTNP